MWPHHFRTRNTTVINNNFGFFPTRPMISHHHCSGLNSGFKWMMGLGMAQTLMGGIFSMFRQPVQTIPMMPYYNFTNTQGLNLGETPITDALADARRTLDSLGFTRNAGYSVQYGDDGKITYAYTNNGQTIIANNLKELLDKQAAARTVSNDDLDIQEEQGGDRTVQAGQRDTEVTAPGRGTEESETVFEEVTTPTPSGHYAASVVDRSPKGWYRSVNANSHNYQFTEEELTKHKGAETGVDFIVNQFAANVNVDKGKLRNELIKKNPSVFNADGNLKENADVNKLDIPTFKWIKENCLTTETELPEENAVLAKAKVKNNRVSLDYKSGNSIYKEGDADDMMDRDVVLVIDGRKYKLLSNGKAEYVDYYQVTNGRPNHYRDFKLIDPATGRFNPNPEEGLWTDREYFTLFSIDGTGSPLAGAKISRNEEGQVIITKNGKTAIMDDVMSKNEPLK